MTVKVQAGVVVGDLNDAVEDIGLFFPPDPSNMKVSTIGGAIAQSAGGPKTFKYGTTKDYVLGSDKPTFFELEQCLLTLDK